jgi:hypothetical protein
MAAKTSVEILQSALKTMKERRLDLAKFLSSPQTSRDDVSRWVAQIAATSDAIEALQKAIAEEALPQQGSGDQPLSEGVR